MNPELEAAGLMATEGRCVCGAAGIHECPLTARAKRIAERWWEAFFVAVNNLGGRIQDAPKSDRGASACAEFADQAVAEAMKRGLL